ncbi:hypothetical protein GGX14DRAFT_358585, partial [Mycena pura]
SYVAASVLSTAWLLVFQFILVGRYRGPSGIPYPRLYAEKAEMEADPKAYVFNCVQREALGQTLENLPILLSTTLITSLKYPIFAASALGLWSLARVGYTLGYATGNPNKVGPYPHPHEFVIVSTDETTAHEHLERVALSHRAL